MSSATLRRRLHHGDVDGRWNEQYESSSDLDSLNEPLLGNNHDYGDRHANQYSLDELLDDEGKKVRLHWTILFSQLLAQWAQWLANIVLSSGSVLGRLLTIPLNLQQKLFAPSLSPLQEERLRKLQRRLQVPFDGSLVEHQKRNCRFPSLVNYSKSGYTLSAGATLSNVDYLSDFYADIDALKQLWRLAFPNREIPPLKSELWKEMGWQGTDPSTDFRGGGYISLENLIYFAEKYPDSFQRLLHKQDGKRAEWEYPFAVAGINISFMLAQMLDLQSGKPHSTAGVRFLQLLAVDEMAFDNLYCVAFGLMDAQWLAKRASYMEFNDVLKSTRAQLERELELEDIFSVKDLPAYNLLRR